VSNTRVGKFLMQVGINTLTCTRVPRDILPTSIIPTPPMALPKPSTGALNIYAAAPSDLRNLT